MKWSHILLDKVCCMPLIVWFQKITIPSPCKVSYFNPIPLEFQFQGEGEGL